jgi:hypothetical protein
MKYTKWLQEVHVHDEKYTYSVFGSVVSGSKI